MQHWRVAHWEIVGGGDIDRRRPGPSKRGRGTNLNGMSVFVQGHHDVATQETVVSYRQLTDRGRNDVHRRTLTCRPGAPGPISVGTDVQDVGFGHTRKLH